MWLQQFFVFFVCVYIDVVHTDDSEQPPHALFVECAMCFDLDSLADRQLVVYAQRNIGSQSSNKRGVRNSIESGREREREREREM